MIDDVIHAVGFYVNVAVFTMALYAFLQLAEEEFMHELRNRYR